MKPTRNGSLKLFTFSGIDVFIHWSWFVVALIELQFKTARYHLPMWSVLEYLALFGMVLIHEFGHAFACRSVGGKSDTIVLWPLGGVAYVDPPMRPGAMLWSIAAGPLVNVVLLPIFGGAYLLASRFGLADSAPDTYKFIVSINVINAGLLVFNLLPIYPLDGGKILWSLLWFFLGKARSLFVSTIVGFAGVALIVLLAVMIHSTWTGIIAAYILFSCWAGLKYAQALSKIAKLPKHTQFTCPSCKASPPIAALWKCARCGARFDTFAVNATCPGCAQVFATTKCFECHQSAPFEQWSVQSTTPPVIPA